jgi:hypothetical protein
VRALLVPKSDAIASGFADALLGAKVSLCRLDRNVAEQELDLLDLASGRVAQPRACVP